MKQRPLYLDHHATTPVDPRVLAAMLPFFTDAFGNASSRTHAYGWEADEAVEHARMQVAGLIRAAPGEIIFTSGATEANNLAIKGVFNEGSGGHIITIATEHSSVLATCRRLAGDGISVTILPVQSSGLVDLRELESAITPHTLLISVMSANNEIGVLQPLDEISRIARHHRVLLHTDATQAAGLTELNASHTSVDLVSLSAHKLYGPKGVGALYVRRQSAGERLKPLVHGGDQERGVRSGSLNVPGIVGMGAACALAGTLRVDEAARLARLRDQLEQQLTAALDHVSVNGKSAPRLPNNLNISFAGIDGEALLMQLPDLAVSSGSACGSAVKRPSHVLTALGVAEEMAHATLRFGLGRSSTAENIDYAAQRVIEAVRRLRDGRSP